MANILLRLCCNLDTICKGCYQCTKNCGCAERKVFYNFDGTVEVEPLVSYFKPTNSLARDNLIKGMRLDKDVLKKGLSPVEQIAAVINFAHENQFSARAVGTGSSWSKLTTVRDILIDMKELDNILHAEPQTDDGSIFHVKVQAGKLVKDFVKGIDKKYKMALPTLSPYTKMTVGGVISTSTHGLGRHIQTMSNFVVELNMVIARGIQVKIRLPKDGDTDETFESVKCRIESAKYGDPPIEICSTDIFRAAAVGLGSLGVIYSVTFQCIPMYNVKEIRRSIEIKWPTKKESKKFKIPTQLKELSAEPGKYLTIALNPFVMESGRKAGRAVLKAGYFNAERTDERSTRRCQCLCCCVACQCNGCTPAGQFDILQTDCTANTVQGLTNCCPSCIPCSGNFLLRQLLRQQDTVDIDKYYSTFSYFRGNVHASEAGYFVPLEDLDNVLADIIGIMNESLKYRVYSLLPLYVRMIKADDLYLSPVNRKRPDGTCSDYYAAVDVPFLPGAYGIYEFHQKLEDHLFTKYKARPHWGKNLFLNLDSVDQLYPDLDKWKRVYLLFNSDGTFDNEFTRKVGFEDFRHSQTCHVSGGTVHTIATLSAQVEVSRKELHTSVISTQPKRSKDHRPDPEDGRSHFIPRPLSQYRT